MNRKKLSLSGIINISALLLFPGCTTPKPALTPEPATTPTKSPVEDVAKWDLVFISDSSGWNVGEKYAEFIESDLGVDVTLHNFALGDLSARSVVNYLHDPDGLQYDLKLRTLGLAELLPKADVVVFYANPRAADYPGDWDCVTEEPYVVDCSPETFDGYRADLAAIYDVIFSGRGDAPIIVRAFDAYNPMISIWHEHDVADRCKGCWENYNEVIHQAAAAYNVPVAHVYDAFNGPNHDEDPRDKGYISEIDGIHTAGSGWTLIAELLRELGYEYTVPE